MLWHIGFPLFAFWLPSNISQVDPQGCSLLCLRHCTVIKVTRLQILLLLTIIIRIVHVTKQFYVIDFHESGERV